MKRIITSIILMLLVVAASAQNISVASFKPLLHDQSANLQGTMKLDQNGEVCAIIKVQTTATGLTFDVGSLGIVATEQKAGEVWVYVPHGVKRISIGHPTLGFIRDYQIPSSVDAARAYELVLTTGIIHTMVEEAVTQQYLVFQVEPENAMVEVDGTMWDVDRGQAMKYMPFGKYDYRVTAKNYHPEAGKVEVNNPDNKHIMNIKLRPAFGWIEVKGADVQDASIYIDDELVGMAPFKSGILASGQHTVTIKRPMYKAMTQTVTVTDGETTTVSPSLSADFSNVTVKVEGGAEIWINGEKKGTGQWSGALTTGNYNFETRKENHRKAQHTQEITASAQPVTINLPAPTPIYGSLNISTTPAMSQILIDGQPMGETPKLVRQLLIGKHNITVRKEGYGDYNTSVNIEEGKTATVEGRLSDAVNVTFTSNVPDAILYVDGVAVGQSAGTYSVGFGQHTLTVNAEECEPYNESINVTQSTNTFAINVLPIFGNKIFNINGISFTMIAIEGETFTMGATTEQKEPNSNEEPTHKVTLNNYYIGETEVTQSLWDAVMGKSPSKLKEANKPVKKISWNNCQKFIQKLNFLTGENFRLPTEAEWEFAARGGNKSQQTQYSGSSDLNEVAWYCNNSGSTTHDVKTKQPNELGIYDMSGNVKEWCNDWYGGYSSSKQTNPTGPSSGSSHVVRGGSWYDDAADCRSTNRNGYAPSNSYNYFGFRLALDGYQGDISAIKITEPKTANFIVDLEKITGSYGEKSAEELFKLGEEAYSAKDYAKAFALYHKSADLGLDSAQNSLAWMYKRGYGVTQDYTMAVYWYHKAAKQGNTKAQNYLGLMYDEGLGVPQNYLKAVYWYQKAAEQGNPFGQLNLGLMYHHGSGVSQDYVKALFWYKKAADQGNGSAQNQLGSMYHDGLGVSQDYSKALYWYKKAAEQGDEGGQTNLGWMYHYGLGISRDYTKALYWYKKAAEQESSFGQNQMGWMYHFGLGVSQDYSKALYWYKKAAEQGNGTAQNNIGVLYEEGKGVTKNIHTALHWYGKAAAQGNEAAKKALQRLSQRSYIYDF